MNTTLAELTLTNTQIGIGAIAFVVTLIGYHFKVGQYIREQAGVKETKAVEITGQPLKTQTVARYVMHEELIVMLKGYVTTDDLYQTEKRLDTKIEANFRSLDEKRSRSIGNLHEHLTNESKALSEKIETSSERKGQEIGETHKRIDSLGQQVGVLIGEVRGLAQIARDAAQTAQQAAISAAKAQS